ncbi:hypothetical protein ABKV19_026693, partial [Rosa sericea]
MLKSKSLLMKKTGNEQKQQKRQPQQLGKRQPQQLGKRQPPPTELQQPEPSQQVQPQPPIHSGVSDHDISSEVKNTRGVTKGIGTHDIVTASNERILIQMNEDQKLPNGVQANS